MEITEEDFLGIFREIKKSKRATYDFDRTGVEISTQTGEEVFAVKIPMDLEVGSKIKLEIKGLSHSWAKIVFYVETVDCFKGISSHCYEKLEESKLEKRAKRNKEIRKVRVGRFISTFSDY